MSLSNLCWSCSLEYHISSCKNNHDMNTTKTYSDSTLPEPPERPRWLLRACKSDVISLYTPAWSCARCLYSKKYYRLYLSTSLLRPTVAKEQKDYFNQGQSRTFYEASYLPSNKVSIFIQAAAYCLAHSRWRLDYLPTRDWWEALSLSLRYAWMLCNCARLCTSTCASWMLSS